MYMLDTHWSMHSGQLIIIHPNLSILNNMAKVLYASLCKHAFIMLSAQLMLAQLLKC